MNKRRLYSLALVPGIGKKVRSLFSIISYLAKTIKNKLGTLGVSLSMDCKARLFTDITQGQEVQMSGLLNQSLLRGWGAVDAAREVGRETKSLASFCCQVQLITGEIPYAINTLQELLTSVYDTGS